jgi:hypothetical protein
MVTLPGWPASPEKLITANPDRGELLRSGIEACEVATKLRARGVVGGKDRGGRFELTEEQEGRAPGLTRPAGRDGCYGG